VIIIARSSCGISPTFFSAKLVRAGPVISKKMQVAMIEVITEEPVSAPFTLSVLNPCFTMSASPMATPAYIENIERSGLHSGQNSIVSYLP